MDCATDAFCVTIQEPIGIVVFWVLNVAVWGYCVGTIIQTMWESRKRRKGD